MSFAPMLTTKRILRKLGGDKIPGKVLTLYAKDVTEDSIILPGELVKVTDEVIDLTKVERVEFDVGEGEVLVFTDLTVVDIDYATGVRRLDTDGITVALVVGETQEILGELHQKGTYIALAQVSSTLVIPETIHPIDPKYLPPLTSPSGKQFKLTVDDNGTITATEVV